MLVRKLLFSASEACKVAALATLKTGFRVVAGPDIHELNDISDCEDTSTFITLMYLGEAVIITSPVLVPTLCTGMILQKLSGLPE